MPTRGSDSRSGINNSRVNDNVINTENNDRIIDRPSINNNNVNTANVSAVNTRINKNSINNANVSTVNISTNKPSGAPGKVNTDNINATRAKFEEDLKKEPILQTILDVFDGELLN